METMFAWSRFIEAERPGLLRKLAAEATRRDAWARHGVTWPENVFLPSQLTSAIVTGDFGKGEPLSAREATMASIATAIATWNLTRGVYRMDTDLVDALVADPPLDVPGAALAHLPEWCVCLDISATRLGADHGALILAYLDHGRCGDEVAPRTWLALIPLICLLGTTRPALCTPVYVPLDGTIRDMLWFDVDASSGGVSHKAAAQLVALLAYVCSVEPDVRGHEGAAWKPRRPRRPKDTKRGWETPPQPTIWYTGFRVGALIRRAHDPNAQPTGDQVRPHVRRAHWHLYWTGAGRETPRMRWLHPILVHGEAPELTVREVEKPRNATLQSSTLEG